MVAGRSPAADREDRVHRLVAFSSRDQVKTGIPFTVQRDHMNSSVENGVGGSQGTPREITLGIQLLDFEGPNYGGAAMERIG